MAHTHGPWEIDGTKALGAYGVWTAYTTHPGHDGSGYASQICSLMPGDLSSDITREQRDANAQLISAAPELLEVVRVLAETPWEKIYIKRLQEMARAALDKATGK